jgi:hypothetical protein
MKRRLQSRIMRLKEYILTDYQKMNLLAYSMKQSLAFYARQDQIQVFQTKLTCSNSLLFHYTKDSTLLGTVATTLSSTPYIINAIYVSQIGANEALLVACDTGAILIWFTCLLHDPPIKLKYFLLMR